MLPRTEQPRHPGGVKLLFDVVCRRPWLIAQFGCPQRMMSWSLNRPGFVRADTVAWLEVTNEELRHVTDPARWLRQRISDRHIDDAVGLLTARNVSRYEKIDLFVEDVQASCLVTLGLNNGEHIGARVQPRRPASPAGTINILCAVSVPLSEGALVEAASIVTQARTVALIEAGYRRPGEQKPVTGTGTDCIVVSAPGCGVGALHAGMHTAVGEAVGAAVLKATRAATESWRMELAPDQG